MVEARIKASPADDLVPYLEALLEGLAKINEAWLRQQIALGRDPPCCTSCAKPPWTPGRGVDYVPWHGSPRGTSREYLDGPTMFARGQGTCFDIVGYDIAAHRVKDGDAAFGRIVPLPGTRNEFHALLQRGNGALEDPATALAEREPYNVGAVRRNGVIVGLPRRESASIDALEPILGSGAARGQVIPSGSQIRGQLQPQAAGVRRNQLGADVRGQAVRVQRPESFWTRGGYNVGGCRGCERG